MLERPPKRSADESTDDNAISIAEAMERVKRRHLSESRGCKRPGREEDTAREASRGRRASMEKVAILLCKS